jgi:hypothetical protein
LLIRLVGACWHGQQTLYVDAIRTGQMLTIELYRTSNLKSGADKEAKKLFRAAVAVIAKRHGFEVSELAGKRVGYELVIIPQTEVAGVVQEVCDKANALLPLCRTTYFAYGSVDLKDEHQLDMV